MPLSSEAEIISDSILTGTEGLWLVVVGVLKLMNQALRQGCGPAWKDPSLGEQGWKNYRLQDGYHQWRVVEEGLFEHLSTMVKANSWANMF